MNIEILSVGTELLLGDILNTNVQYLCRECAELGHDVFRTTVVGDNEKRLYVAISEAMKRADLLLLTGGLGSTHDDVTKKTVLCYVNRPAMKDAESAERIDHWFENKQAQRDNQIVTEFPTGAKVFQNHHGTAGGAWIPVGKKAIIILPGPPREMMLMFEESVRPLLKLSSTITKSLIVRIGILGEYEVNRRFSEEIALAKNPSFAPYVKDDGTLLRITAKGKTEKEADELLSAGLKKVRSHFPEQIVAVGEESKAQVLLRILKEKNEWIATAESLTGGELAATIVDVPGASHHFSRGWVTYTDAAKVEELDIPENIVKDYGAVSRETAMWMARRAAIRSNAQLGVSTTGYAGPEGNPVGRVFIGIDYRGKTEVHEFHLHGDRQMIRQRACNLAMDHAILRLRKEELWDE